MVVTHISILLAAIGGAATGLAAAINAIKGRKVSARNEQALIVIHELLNGKAAEREAELAAARRELAALRGNVDG